MSKRKLIELDNNFISSKNIKNYLLKDPILDYLEIYGNETKNDFVEFIKKKGLEFERDVMEKFPCEYIKANEDSFHKIILLLKKKTPVIYQGVLYNYKNETFGYPDLIIRGDYLNKYFNENENPDNYYIIDIKYSSIYLSSDKSYILNSGLFPYYKCQLLLYTLALNEILNQNVTKSFILGKRIISTSKGNKMIYKNEKFNKLCTINYSKIDYICYQNLNKAIEWNKKLRKNGNKWSLLPIPSVIELYPNMSNKLDLQWHSEKKKIAIEIKELTNIIYVGPKERDFAFKKNIYSYDNINCSAANLNIKGKRAIIVDNIIKINNGEDIILPKKIKSNYWRVTNDKYFEFYLDYETTTDFIDNIYIFMIGLGFILNNKWVFKSFILKKKENGEKELFDEFWEYINNLLKVNNKKEALFIHWTSAEPLAYNNIKKKLNIPDKNFLDLYQVFINEPIVIKGAFNYSLKSIANAMYHNELISTLWDSNSQCSNGLNALFLAYEMYNSSDIELNNEKLKDIRYYNEVDCKVLYEILEYIRKYH